jgi:hypothetical protein
MKSKQVRDDRHTDKLLQEILLQCGQYFQPGALFYQRLWRERLRHLGFRVIAIEKQQYHHLWEIRLRGTLTAQAYLLLSKMASPKSLRAKDLLVEQLKAEIHLLAKEMGPPLKRDEIMVTRTGAYVRVVFLWAAGEPGLLMRKEKQADAFPFLIRPWLRKIRN